MHRVLKGFHLIHELLEPESVSLENRCKTTMICELYIYREAWTTEVVNCDLDWVKKEVTF